MLLTTLHSTLRCEAQPGTPDDHAPSLAGAGRSGGALGLAAERASLWLPPRPRAAGALAQRPRRPAASLRRRAARRDRRRRRTGASLARAQSRALLDGPFPGGGLARGISDGTLLLRRRRRRARTGRSRGSAPAGATVVRIPVDWRDVVLAPAAGRLRARATRPARRMTSAALDAAVRGDGRRRPRAAARRLARAGVGGSARALAVRLPRQLGAGPGRARAVRRRARAPLRRLASPTPALRARRCRACACCRPGTSRTSPATSSRSGSPPVGSWRAFSPLLYRRC